MSLARPDPDALLRSVQAEERKAGSDRLLVCISPSPFSANLLRVGRRIASGLRVKWFAVNVETPATLRLGPADRARISQNLRLAEQLGAETVTLTGERAAEEILRFAREQNVTKIVAGKPRVRRWRDRLRAGFVDELILRSEDIDIYVTVGDEANADSIAAQEIPWPQPRGTKGYLAGATMTVLATVVGALVFGRSQLADVVMTYLLGVVLISMRFSFRASVATAIFSVLAFDFVFIPPYLTFTVSNIRHIVTFAVMLFVAVVVAGLTQRAKDQMEVARRSERRTAVLYAMTRDLAQAQGLGIAIRTACRHIEEVFDARAAVFTRDAQGDLQRTYATEGFDAAAENDIGIVRWVWSHQREAGLGSDSVPGGRGLYVPLCALSTDREVAGVLGLFPNDLGRFAEPEQRRLVDALATQMAMAMERAELADETQRTRIQVEAEQLRSTLLSSVSHDLRTPLAVMKGAASTLVDDDAALAPSTRRDMAQTILEETDRLERLVRNLLDMTRLESGAVRVKKEWQSVEEAVGGALSRVEARLGGRDVTSRIPAELLAPFDGVLVEQVLVNLLENAAKHTDEGTPIEINAVRAGNEVVVDVADRGPGLPEGEEELVFEKFHRSPSERAPAGVGLGLAICRAIVTAHGGRIWAQNRSEGGACFTFALPLEGEVPYGKLPEIQEKGGG